MDNVMEKPWFIPAVVGVSASIGGAAIGLFAGLRIGYQAGINEQLEEFEVDEEEEETQLEFEFDATVEDIQLVDQEALREVVREGIQRIDVRIPAFDPNPRNDPRDIMVAEPPMVIDTSALPEIVPISVFDTEYDHWDYEEEVPNRTKEKPYILHRDEFWAEEENYDQSTLTYYVEDDILTDQDDTPIYGYLSVTGPLLFGHGSGDPNVVHVRNDKQSAEYEIIRVDGSYAREILGVGAEDAAEQSDLKHSVRKFRPRDD
jgi:hypothetical protein